MNCIALILALLLSTGGKSVEGYAKYYAEGVMERVVEYRLLVGNIQPCPACIGYVALLDRADVGQRVWLKRPGLLPEGPFLVADCAQAEHRAAMMANDWVVDVDWPTARRWRMRAPLANVWVLRELPELAEPGPPRRRKPPVAPPRLALRPFRYVKGE